MSSKVLIAANYFQTAHKCRRLAQVFQRWRRDSRTFAFIDTVFKLRCGHHIIEILLGATATPNQSICQDVKGTSLIARNLLSGTFHQQWELGARPAAIGTSIQLAFVFIRKYQRSVPKMFFSKTQFQNFDCIYFEVGKFSS
jgi:hypothetical protein